MINSILKETKEQVYVIKSQSSKPQWLSRVDNEISIRNFQVRENLTILYEFSRNIFQVGQYEIAEFFIVLYLQFYSNILGQLKGDKIMLKIFNKKHEKNYSKAYWGRLSCRLLLNKDSMSLVNQMIVNWEQEKTKSYEKIAKNRCWILHAILFQNLINDKDGQGINKLLELFNKEQYRNTIITVCPWLLRYLVLAVVCSEQKLGQKIIQCEIIAKFLKESNSTCADPLIKFLKNLFVDCNFENASINLNKCRKVFTIDLFSCGYCQMFFNQTRFLFFSKYIHVNNEISMEKIGLLLLLDQYGEFEDDHTWSVGQQPVHYEPRHLNQWIIDTVCILQKEKSSQENNQRDTEHNLSLRIDLQKKRLISKPVHKSLVKNLLYSAKKRFFEAKDLYDLLL